MNQRNDRTRIAPLLLPFFPEMADQVIDNGDGTKTVIHKTSDDWHAFLDATTGFTTPLEESNASAFDRWRQTLAAMDIPVWKITATAAAQMTARGEELKQLAALARASQAERTAIEMARLAALKK